MTNYSGIFWVCKKMHCPSTSPKQFWTRSEIFDLSRNCFRQIQDIFSIWIKFSSKTSFLDLVYIENQFWTCTVRHGGVRPVEGISVLYDFCLRHFSLLFRTRHETLFWLWTNSSQIVKNFVPNMPFLVFNFQGIHFSRNMIYIC